MVGNLNKNVKIHYSKRHTVINSPPKNPLSWNTPVPSSLPLSNEVLVVLLHIFSWVPQWSESNQSTYDSFYQIKSLWYVLMHLMRRNDTSWFQTLLMKGQCLKSTQNINRSRQNFQKVARMVRQVCWSEGEHSKGYEWQCSFTVLNWF